MRRNRLGIKDPNKPIGSFIFLGSTGVGKTHLAKQLAKQIFGSADNLIRVDMSEYQEKHTVSRLIGAPPGYVGYDEGGQLTEQVKNKPYSVVLFDEVEKANKEIFNTLLQMLDEGHLTDSLGRKINFKNTLIIMTSNIGVKKLQDFGTGIGFGGSSYSSEEQKKEILKKEMKNYFSPEFLNRIDETIIFNSLDQESLKSIVSIELKKLMKRLVDLKLNFTFDDKLVEHISKVGFDEVYGARPIKRAIQDEVEDLVSESVLSDTVKEGENYTLTVEDDKVVIK
jgi:ATP-dependent Clp protease ATP-binding subunit ClpC